MQKVKTYAQDFKNKLVQECAEVNNLTLVAKKHGVPISTLNTWVSKSKLKKNPSHPKALKNQVTKLQKELDDKELEIKILKELLKKTNQVWLKD